MKNSTFPVLDHRQLYSGSSRNIHQVVDIGFQQWNSFFAANCFRFPFRIAGDERAVGAGSRFGIAEDLNSIVDLFFELVFVDEAIDLHGAESMGYYWRISNPSRAAVRANLSEPDR